MTPAVTTGNRLSHQTSPKNPKHARLHENYYSGHRALQISSDFLHNVRGNTCPSSSSPSSSSRPSALDLLTLLGSLHAPPHPHPFVHRARKEKSSSRLSQRKDEEEEGGVWKPKSQLVQTGLLLPSLHLWLTSSHRASIFFIVSLLFLSSFLFYF